MALSHAQYEELIRYGDGFPHYMFRAPSKSLTTNGYLARQPNSGHDRASSAFHITAEGRDAITFYREKWGIVVADADIGRCEHGLLAAFCYQCEVVAMREP